MEPLKYLELMKANDLTVNDLPKEIKLKINALKPTIARYNNSSPKSTPLFEAIVKQDVGIAEMIADFIERDLPDAPEETEEVEKNEEIKSDSVQETKEQVIEEKTEEPIKEEVVIPVVEVKPVVEDRPRKYSSGTLEMEKRILEACKPNGHISTEDLCKITGKSSWSLSVSVEEVYSIQLRKVYQKNLYRLID